MPLIRTNTLKDTLYAVSQLDRPDPCIYSITDGKWKWYDYRLFDLQNDPRERYDVYADNKEIAEFLEARLNEIVSFRQIFLNNQTRLKKERMNADLKEKLKSLGYL